MILVLLNDKQKPFIRLLKSLDNSCKRGDITEGISVITKCKYIPNELSKNMFIHNNLTDGKFKEYIQKSSLVITHGDMKMILMSLSLDKKVIVVPKKKVLKETRNNDEENLTLKLEKEGYIFYLKDLNRIDEFIKKVKVLRSKEYNHNHDNLINKIVSYIENN